MNLDQLQALLRRGTPCEPTEAGVGLVRVARHMLVLEQEAWAGLGRTAAGRSVTSLAVPADVLGTWFGPVLAEAADWEDTVLDLHVEDQDHSARLLRRGEVLAAVTTEPQPVQGCAAEPLGSMRYVPLASPALLARHAAGDVVDLGAMPMMRYNAKDDLQRLALSGAGLDVAPPTHLAPSFDGFHRSVRAGLGWGMLPEEQLAPLERDGRLVRLAADRPVGVPLHWQRWRLDSPLLDRLTDAVRSAAGRHLG